jgi:hypothetical protein
MEAMLDTNVLFSSIFFPSENMNALMEELAKRHLEPARNTASICGTQRLACFTRL